MSVVVALEGVSKSFRTYRNSIDRVASWFGLRRTAVRSHDAVRDVSFSVSQGEAVALIGQNGAGKSTLLKLITGTLRPSAGAIHLVGHLSAVLELGLGFHPELTGRQNVLHAGGLLGYSHDELLAMLPVVQEFAELGPFFDQPLRTYSSGMQARLAFSLATARRPDILIIDEVLSVGDSYFQHKSFSRIREFKDEGTSLLFVSHGMADVRALCDRVVLIDAGSIVKDGPADEVIDYYNALVLAKGNELNFEQRRNPDGWLSSRSGSRSVDVTSIDLVDAKTAEELKTLKVGQAVTIRLTIHAFLETKNLVAGILVRDKHGHIVWGTNTAHLDMTIPSVGVDRDVTVLFHLDCNLGPGSYSLSPAAVSWVGDLDTTFDWHDNALVFDVVNADQPLFVGSTHLDVEATVLIE